MSRKQKVLQSSDEDEDHDKENQGNNLREIMVKKEWGGMKKEEYTSPAPAPPDWSEQRVSSSPTHPSTTNTTASSTTKLARAQKIEYNAHIKEAREFEKSGAYKQALASYEQAQAIHNADAKLSKKIKQLTQQIEERRKTKQEVRRQSVLQSSSLPRASSASCAPPPAQEGWLFDAQSDTFQL
eukprot:1327361-Rhodomonas_salina.1